MFTTSSPALMPVRSRYAPPGTNSMKNDIVYRRATLDDVLKLSVLYKQVYIHTYAKEGVSDEFANFITRQFSPDRIKSHLLLDPDHIYVAEYNSNLVGVLELEFEKKCPVGEIIAPEVNKLYILDWFCGRGIGRELMKIAEHLALTRGSNLGLEVKYSCR